MGVETSLEPCPHPAKMLHIQNISRNSDYTGDCFVSLSVPVSSFKTAMAKWRGKNVKAVFQPFEKSVCVQWKHLTCIAIQINLGAFPAAKKPPAMQGMSVRSLGQEDPLEEEMTTHSSVLACRIPWSKEPGGYSPWVTKESHIMQATAYTLDKPSGHRKYQSGMMRAQRKQTRWGECFIQLSSKKSFKAE